MAHHNDLIGHNTSTDRNKTKSLALPFRLYSDIPHSILCSTRYVSPTRTGRGSTGRKVSGAKFPRPFWGRYTREVS